MAPFPELLDDDWRQSLVDQGWSAFYCPPVLNGNQQTILAVCPHGNEYACHVSLQHLITAVDPEYVVKMTACQMTNECDTLHVQPILDRAYDRVKSQLSPDIHLLQDKWFPNTTAISVRRGDVVDPYQEFVIGVHMREIFGKLDIDGINFEAIFAAKCYEVWIRIKNICQDSSGVSLAFLSQKITAGQVYDYTTDYTTPWKQLQEAYALQEKSVWMSALDVAQTLKQHDFAPVASISEELNKLFPSLGHPVPHPETRDLSDCGDPESDFHKGGNLDISRMIQHLNDSHKWTREQIADWLDTLDVDLTIAPNNQGD